MSYLYILGNLSFGVAAILLLVSKKAPWEPRTYFGTVLAFAPLDLFHAYMIGRIYVYGSGTTQILLGHMLYLDDIVFFFCFPFFVSVFVTAFAKGNTADIQP